MAMTLSSRRLGVASLSARKVTRSNAQALIGATRSSDEIRGRSARRRSSSVGPNECQANKSGTSARHEAQLGRAQGRAEILAGGAAQKSEALTAWRTKEREAKHRWLTGLAELQKQRARVEVELSDCPVAAFVHSE